MTPGRPASRSLPGGPPQSLLMLAALKLPAVMASSSGYGARAMARYAGAAGRASARTASVPASAIAQPTATS